MLGSNSVQAVAAVTQFDPAIRLRYKNQRKKEGAPSRLTCRIADKINTLLDCVIQCFIDTLIENNRKPPFVGHKHRVLFKHLSTELWQNRLKMTIYG